MVSAPSRMPVVALPGTPSTSVVMMSPPEQALLALSEATTPSTLPLPYSSPRFDIFRASE